MLSISSFTAETMMPHEPTSLIQYLSIRLPRYLSFYMAMTLFRSKRIRLYSKQYINSFWIQSVFEQHIILAYSRQHVVLLPSVRLSLQTCAPSPHPQLLCLHSFMNPLSLSLSLSLLSLSLSLSLIHTHSSFSFFSGHFSVLLIFTFSYLVLKLIQTLLLCIC